MSLGLSSEYLFMAFVGSFKARVLEFQGLLEGAIAGENPELSEAFSKLREEFPQLSAQHITIARTFILSFLDTIAANNEALARAVPHLES